MNAIDMHSHFFPREWEDPGTLVRDMQGLSADAKRKLLVGNAQRFLGL